MPTREKSKGQEKREAIAHAAYQCIADDGYHGASVEGICERAGVSKGSFYWYFKSKQEVFLHILETWADQVGREISSQFQDVVDGPQVFAALGRAMNREVHRGRAIMPVWLEFLNESVHDEQVRAVMERFHRRIRDTIVALLAPLLSARFGPDQVDSLGVGILATFMGLVCQDLVAPGSANFEANAKHIIHIIQSLATGDGSGAGTSLFAPAHQN